MIDPIQDPPDAVSLAALMSSRICHDLINPVGALSSGLEVLVDPGTDSAMRDAAIDLIQSSAEKSVALLKYARLAYGASGGLGARLPFEEARRVLEAMFGFQKAKLDWSVTPVDAPKNEVRAVLILGLAAADCAPRGGVVTIRGEGGRYSIDVASERIILQDEFFAAIDGETDDMKPKFAPHYLAGLMAREAGGEVELAREDEGVRMRLSFSRRSGQTERPSLTAG